MKKFLATLAVLFVLTICLLTGCTPENVSKPIEFGGTLNGQAELSFAYDSVEAAFVILSDGASFGTVSFSPCVLQNKTGPQVVLRENGKDVQCCYFTVQIPKTIALSDKPMVMLSVNGSNASLVDNKEENGCYVLKFSYLFNNYQSIDKFSVKLKMIVK